MKTSINTILNLAVAASVLLGISALVLYTSLSSYDMAFRLEEQAIKQMGDNTSKSLSMYMQGAADLAASMAAQPAMLEALAGDPAKANQLMEYNVKSFEYLNSAFLMDTKGAAVAGYIRGGLKFAAGYADRDYFKAVIAGQDKTFSKNVVLAKSAGKNIFVACKAIRDASGKLLGMAAVTYFWDPFAELFINTVKFGQKGYACMVDGSGMYIAHSAKKDLILKEGTPPDFVKKALQLKDGVMEFEDGGARMVMAVDQNPITGWTILSVANVSEMTAYAASQRNVLLGLGAAVLVVVVLLITWINRTLVLSPVRALQTYSERIASGDFAAELSGRFRYEMELLAGNIRGMVDELKNKLGFAEGVLKGIPSPCSIVGPDHKMRWINQKAMDLMENRESIDSQIGLSSGAFYFADANRHTVADETIDGGRAVSTRIEYPTRTGKTLHLAVDSTPFYDMDGKLLGATVFWNDLTDLLTQQRALEEQNTVIARAAAEATDVADRMSSAAQELSAQIEQSTHGAQIQNDRVGQTATALEEMNATILEVAKNAADSARMAGQACDNAREGAHLVSEVVSAIGMVREEATALKGDMRGLEEKSNGIGAILNTISDIADQTNLLALNAAIEAARAGEAGRGFAVVADEVRKLAEKTMTATKEVGQSITGIQQGTSATMTRMDKAVSAVERATELAGRSGESLGGIVTMVETAGDQSRSIATAAEQQSSASTEINRTVAEISRISTETADAMTQSAQAVEELAQLAQALNRLIGELRSDQQGPKALA